MIAADPRAARPGVALRPIAKIGDLKCRIPQRSTTRRERATRGCFARTAPIFVNLPEITDDAAKPYPDGTNDYQPSAVDVFFDSISTVRQAPRGLLGWAQHRLHRGVVRPAGPAGAAGLLDAPVEWVLGMLVLAVINTGLALIVIRSRVPLGEHAVRRRGPPERDRG